MKGFSINRLPREIAASYECTSEPGHVYTHHLRGVSGLDLERIKAEAHRDLIDLPGLGEEEIPPSETPAQKEARLKRAAEREKDLKRQYGYAIAVRQAYLLAYAELVPRKDPGGGPRTIPITVGFPDLEGETDADRVIAYFKGERLPSDLDPDEVKLAKELLEHHAKQAVEQYTEALRLHRSFRRPTEGGNQSDSEGREGGEGIRREERATGGLPVVRADGAGVQAQGV